MIRMSKLADYGVLILSKLAGAPGELKTAGCLSRETGLPEPTVSKVMKILAKSGLIRSVRGIGGGYRLDRDPESITLLEVISALDGPVGLTSCVKGRKDSCAIGGHCGLEGCWDEINEAICGTLDHMTLKQMLDRKTARGREP